ncbi:putative LPS assembly protein LptD [Labilibaculum antarcticum]|uniref:putative LPS assembly protein LptD n=1 Tax=Labilibaculum antarcticum TaxID=1717717 RepID=UPI0011AB68DF|nr:putative LPS assembly protein LptD [Labilibaculum antarcticum]
MKLLQRVFIIFIGITFPLTGFALINSTNNSDNYQPVTSWSGEDFSRFVDFKISEKDTLLKVASDTLATDSIKKEDKPFFEASIEYNSDDTIVFSLTGQKVFLTKNSFVKYGEIELRAYYIELDLDKKEAFAYGIKDSTGTFIDTPEFKDGAEEFTCKELKYNFDTGKGLVNEIITEQEGGYVHSEITKRIDDKTFYLKNGKYTTCDDPHPHFYVKMTKAKMIKDDKIVSGPLYLVLEDVPMPIGLPFALFPFSSSYSSGIIMPSYGEEQRRGFNLRGGGYYWAMNEYMDLAVTGDIFANGSWGGYVESKYKTRYRYSGNLATEYHSNKYGDEGLSDYSESTDFAIRWTHTQDSKANPYRTFSASVNFSTSNNDRNNSTSIQKITNNQKQSSISYSKKWADSPFSLNGSLRHSQNSRDTTISLTLPSMSLNMTQIYPFRAKGKSTNLRWYDKVGVSYSSKLENKINTKESELMSSSLATDWDNGYQHSIPISTNFKLTKDLTLSPTLNYQGVLYSKSISKSWDTEMNDGDGGVHIDTIQGFKYAHNYSTSASLSLSPKIYGMYTFKESSKLAAIRHVMTPSISVSYTPEIGIPRSKYYKTYRNETTDKDVEYSMFEGGVYGTPTGAKESGSVSFGLDNNVEAKMRTANDSTGTEEFKKVKIIESLKFSTSYNMFADSLNWSTIRMSGRTKLFNKKLGLNVGSTVDPYKLNANNIKINKFGPRLTNASIDLDFGLSAKDVKGDDKDDKNEKSKEPWRDTRYINFDIPWSFAIDYGWTYSKPSNKKSTVRQNMGVTGNVSLTPKWKMSFSTGYDFTEKEITSSQFTITRDLHCWQMSFNAIPFGTYQSYNFRINVQSSILQDLKYEKKQAWQDVSF